MKKLKPVHPGEILHEEFMKPLGLSMNKLALDLRVPVTRIAKTKTTIQMVAIGAMILEPLAAAWLPQKGALTYTAVAYGGLWLAAALTVGTGYAYFRAGLAHLNPRAASERRPRKSDARAQGRAGEAV